MKYYISGSDTYYLESSRWVEERDFLMNNECRLLNVDEANQFDLTIFFKKNDDDIKPNLDKNFKYFIIPYELDDCIVGDLSADEIIIGLISDNLKSNIYLASTDKDKCCFVECKEINEDILYNLYSNHINTPFVIFDKNKNFFSLVDFDLPIQIIGYKGEVLDKNEFISNRVSQLGWLDLFKRYGHYTNLRYIFEKYYKSLL